MAVRKMPHCYETRVPYGITQCYLSPPAEVTVPSSGLGVRLPSSGTARNQ